MICYIGSIPCVPSDLQHWGILGMKWGVRRYRNKDGTLTDAGKARYANSTGRKQAKDMTDSELQAAVNRLRNEKAYNELVKELDKKPEKNSVLKKGMKAAGKVLSVVGGNIVLPAAKKTAETLAGGFTKMFVDEIAEDRKKERKKADEKDRQAREEEERRQREEYLWDEDRFD